jgi:16S rRNA (guanine966-N2)-methyltransferase
VTRIIGGAARGHRLRVPETGTRPTSDRAREAAFSSLESLRGPWTGSVVLDLYAGSGALGLEALSRGASRVDLVESDRAAARVLEANGAAVKGADGVRGVAQVHAMTVQRWLARPVGRHELGPFDVVFCDPPYSTPSTEVAEVLSRLVGVLADGAVIVVERPHRGDPWVWPPGLVALRDRAYGEAHLWIGSVGAAPEASDSVAPC